MSETKWFGPENFIRAPKIWDYVRAKRQDWLKQRTEWAKQSAGEYARGYANGSADAMMDVTEFIVKEAE